MTGDQDNIGVRLADPGCNRADTNFGTNFTCMRAFYLRSSNHGSIEQDLRWSRCRGAVEVKLSRHLE